MLMSCCISAVHRYCTLPATQDIIWLYGSDDKTENWSLLLFQHNFQRPALRYSSTKKISY